MRQRQGIIVMPTTPTLTHEDWLRDQWVHKDLSVAELEDALEDYWERGVLPDWYAP